MRGLSCLFLFLCHLSTISAQEWVSLGDGIEKYERVVGLDFIVQSRLTMIRVVHDRYQVGVIRAREFDWQAASAKALGKKAQALVAVNANFFDENHEALGLVISRGTQFKNTHLGGRALTGIFQFAHDNNSIVLRNKFDGSGVIEAVQAGPRLLAGGAVIPGIRQRSTASRRAGICIDMHNNLLFFVVSGGLGGMTIDELQNVLLEPRIGCVDALNLDGGGSAQLFVSAALPGAPSDNKEVWIEGRDDVPIALGVFAKNSRP